MKHQLIIFDFDGTLADTFPWFVNTIDEAAQRYRFKRLDKNKLNALRNQGAKQILQHLDIPFWKLPFVVRHMRALMKRDIAGITLFPGITDALHTLANNNTTLAIVTTNARDNVINVLGYETAKLFQYIECTSLFGKRAKLRGILKRSQIRPDQTILIGDEIRDAQAAIDTGIFFGAVSWGYNHIDSLKTHGPQKIFTETSELAKQLIEQPTL